MLNSMKAAALVLASLTAAAFAQSVPPLDPPVAFTLQSRPDFRLENNESRKPVSAWSGVINRSSLSTGQTNSFRKNIPCLDYPGPGYRILSEKSE